MGGWWGGEKGEKRERERKRKRHIRPTDTIHSPLPKRLRSSFAVVGEPRVALGPREPAFGPVAVGVAEVAG